MLQIRRTVLAVAALALFSWHASAQFMTSGGAGSATPPGGSTTQIQYNNAGAFGGLSLGDLTNSSGTIHVTGLNGTAISSGVTFPGITDTANLVQSTGTYVGWSTDTFFCRFAAGEIGLSTVTTSCNNGGNIVGNADIFKYYESINAYLVVNGQNSSVFINSLSAGCGSTTTNVGASTAGFTLTVAGTVTGATCVITFATAAHTGWVCQAQDRNISTPSTMFFLPQTASATNSATFTPLTLAGTAGTLTAGDVLAFSCFGQ